MARITSKPIPRDFSHSERKLNVTLSIIFLLFFCFTVLNFSVELSVCDLGDGSAHRAALSASIGLLVCGSMDYTSPQMTALNRPQTATHISYRALRLSIILAMKQTHWFLDTSNTRSRASKFYSFKKHSGSASASSSRLKYRPTCRPSMRA